MIRFLAFLLMALLPASAMAADQVPAFASDRIGVTVHGSGPDVVLIPGLSSSPEVWDSTIAAMPGYRYHVVHVSGFAGRPAGANASGPVFSPVGDEIARYIREARLNHPAIVGHSMGGGWAIMVAGRNPGLVSKVMVVDMLPFLGAMFGPPGATPDSIRPIAEQIRTGIMNSSDAQRATNAQTQIASMVRTESLRPPAIRHAETSELHVSGQSFYELVTTDLTPELRRITVPLTVLWVLPQGAPITEEQMATYYRAAYAPAAQARVLNVPESWHFIMWDNPEFFRRELGTFLGAAR